MKWLIFGVIAWFIYIVFFKASRTSSTPPPKSDKKKKIDGDTMIECPKCSVFVSERDAIIKDGKFYCSKECAGLK
ncbi:MAG: PP0621 family protein [Sulfurospirillaceae bacterium]|nr:PP0621 family protein [Sulfurospirillaceae bacterium]